MIRLGILGSTRGTHLTAIADAIKNHQLTAELAVVVSNQSHAGILSRAENNNIPAIFVDPKGHTRAMYDQAVSTILQQFSVELIVLIGYMRILSKEFIETWSDKVINVHPSLLPAHAGLMDLSVHEAVLEAGDLQSGCTVHYVTEDLDRGPAIIQLTCGVEPNDTPQRLKERVQALESKALLSAIRHIINLSRKN